MPNLVSEVNISVSNNPTNISVATVGLAGPSQDVSQFLTSGQIDNFTLTSGEAAAIYYTKNNESGFLSSLSGLSTGYVQNISGEINNRLTNTGQTLLNQINQITGATGLYYLLSNPAQYANSGNLTSTGATLLNLINGLSGQLDLSGIKINTLTTNLQANSTNLSGNLASTGSNLNDRIISLSGQLDISGGNLQTQINSVTAGTGAFYLSSNEQRIRTNLPTGSGSLYITFNSVFSALPIIFNNIEFSGGIGYYMNISGLSVTGYTAQFSDIIRESGVILYTLAKVF